MATITNIVPIRIDASSNEGGSRFRIIDTLLIDKTCLPITHISSTTNHANAAPEFSIASLVERNASYLTESILADAEVHGAVRSSKHYLGGRLDLLSDTQLYKTINHQISTQLSIALNLSKNDLIPSAGGDASKSPSGYNTESGDNTPDNIQSTSRGSTQEITGDKNVAMRPYIVRIKLRLRHENIIVVDEFDYDVNLSRLDGSDPFSIAKSMVEDLKLPREFEISIASSIVEQIYGIEVPESLDGLGGGASRDVPGAYALNVTQEGSSAGFAQMILDS